MNLLKAVEVFFTLAAVVGGPLLAVMVVPALARRLLKSAHESRDPPPAEVDDARAAEVESLTRRIAELEERLDFAERLLAQQREAGRLGGGR